jgi:hypothetical protein
LGVFILTMFKENKMKFDLRTILKELALPAALIAVISGVLGLLGLDIDVILQVAGTLVGAAALVTLAVNVGKWTGVVNDGTAGKWSAALNLVMLAGIGVTMYFNPSFDFALLDAKLSEFARVAGIVFVYITQIVASKQLQKSVVHGLGISPFSYSLK